MALFQSCQEDIQWNESSLEEQINFFWKEAKKYEDEDNKKCIYYCQKVDSLARQQPHQFADFIIRSNILWADEYETLEEWDEQLSIAEKAHDRFKEYLNPNSLMKTTVLLNYERCRCMDSQGKIDSAIDCYKNVMDNIMPKDLEDTESFGFTIPLSIGFCYNEKGDFNNALVWHETAEKNMRKGDKFYPGYFNHHYGIYYSHLGDTYKAEHYFKSAILEFSKTPQETGDASLKAYIDLIDLYVNQGDLEKCINYLEKASKLRLKKDWSYARINYQYAKVYSKKQEYEKALRYIDLTFPYLDSIKKDRFYLRGKHLTLKGELLAKLGKYNEAMLCFQKALYNLSEQFASNNFQDNPSSISSSQKIELLKTLAKKASVLTGGFLESQNKLTYLKSAVETNETAISLIKLLRTNYNDDQTKELLSSNWFGIFESAIKSAFLYYEKTGDLFYLGKAFEFSETGKALSLLENLHDINAKDFFKIPDSLIEQEYQFKTDILNLENRLADQGNEKDKQHFRDLIFGKRRAFEDWKHKIEREYPEYYLMKYDIKVASVNDIQNSIQPNETIVEYFYGKKYIYIFTIAKTDFKVQSFSITSSFEKDLNYFVQASAKRNKLNKDPKKFMAIGHRLYKLLIEPLNINTEKITIIPDGLLHNLPFAALPSNEKFINNPKKWPYLIKNHVIAYNFSASVMLEQINDEKEITIPLNSLLVIAPEKFPTKNNLEIDKSQLSKLLEHDVDFLERPNKQNVLAALKKGYKYIFFFSHADTSDTHDPFIYLFNDSLFMKELYSTSVNTNTVLLTACVTGAGKNQRGEGVLSLARGFAYQNVPNAVMSLWPIQEDVSKDLSFAFLQYLIVEKMTPSEALRQAQIGFLEQPNEYSGVPFFWAGMVGVGN